MDVVILALPPPRRKAGARGFLPTPPEPFRSPDRQGAASGIPTDDGFFRPPRQKQGRRHTRTQFTAPALLIRLDADQAST